MSALGWELARELDAENPVIGDMRISSGSFARLQDRPSSIAQACTVELRWFFGEWFADTSRGTPWFRDLLGKVGVTEALVRAVIGRQLRKVAGVRRMASASVIVDGTTGHCTVTDVVVEIEGGATTDIDGSFSAAPTRSV